MEYVVDYIPFGAGLVAMAVAAWLMVRRLRKSNLTAFEMFESVILPAVVLASAAAAYYWSGLLLAHPVYVTHSDIAMLAMLAMLCIVLAMVISAPLLLIIFGLGATGLPWMAIAQSLFTILLGAMLGNLVGFVYAIIRRVGAGNESSPVDGS